MTTSVRPSLAWYGPDALDEIEQHNLPSPHMQEYYRQRLTFRDADLRYWQLAADNSWWAWIDDEWTNYQRPASLEGYEPCLLPVSAIAAPDPDSVWEEETISEADMGPAAAIAHAVRLSRDAYFNSLLSMWDAEAMLHRCYAVTRSGRLFTPGAISGKWFEYLVGSWRTAKPPVDHDLQRKSDTASESVQTNFEQLLERGPLLPEPITPDWEPPGVRHSY